MTIPPLEINEFHSCDGVPYTDDQILLLIDSACEVEDYERAQRYYNELIRRKAEASQINPEQ